MKWELDKERPICPQIEEQICVLLAKGEFKKDDKLFSVRDVAVGAGVNPNTVQKAFEALEAKGLIYSVRGSGWFVTESTEKAQEIVDTLIKGKTQAYFDQMLRLGLEGAELKEYIKEFEL